MPLDEARAAWPDKLFWTNINVSLYLLAPKQLRKAVLGLVEQGAVDGRLLAFEISEDLPRNWKESVPVVLDALRETRA
jgi:EAL domain-containing protein (putative c-di-GMP-specific phosphodiesterase class I)